MDLNAVKTKRKLRERTIKFFVAMQSDEGSGVNLEKFGKELCVSPLIRGSSNSSTPPPSLSVAAL